MERGRQFIIGKPYSEQTSGMALRIAIRLRGAIIFTIGFIASSAVPKKLLNDC